MQVKNIAIISPFIKLPFVCVFLGVFVHMCCCTCTESMTLQDYIAEIAGEGGF